MIIATKIIIFFRFNSFICAPPYTFSLIFFPRSPLGLMRSTMISMANALHPDRGSPKGTYQGLHNPQEEPAKDGTGNDTNPTDNGGDKAFKPGPDPSMG